MTNHRHPAAAALLAGLALAAGAFAQVTAKQGQKYPSDVQIFQSPMVLEVPAAPLVALERGGVWNFPGVDKYQCEDARFRSVSFRRTRAGESELEYEVEGFISVADSFDRKATVRVDFLDGDRVVGGASKSRLDAEERKTTRFYFKFQLGASATAALRSSSTPVLRITLEIK